jgi:thioredoxin
MVEHITNDVFEEKVSNASKPVIVDFYADWCGPCKRLAPIFEELSEEVPDVDFYKVNVEEAADLAGQFGVASIPTLIIFKDGEQVDRIQGLMQKEELKSVLESKV